MKINVKEIDTKEAEKIISEFNKLNVEKTQTIKTKSSDKDKAKSKKLVKSNQ